MCISLVIFTYMYHDAWFRECKKMVHAIECCRQLCYKQDAFDIMTMTISHCKASILWTTFSFSNVAPTSNSPLNITAELHRTPMLTLILPRSHTGTVWFYTSTSNKRAAWPKLYTKSLTRDLKLMYSRLTLVRISINL